MIARINPCEIQIVDGRVSCYSSRSESELDGELCCGGCRHLGAEGCTVKALACKLWLCRDVQKTEKGEMARKELIELEREAYRHNVPMPFRSPMES